MRAFSLLFVFIALVLLAQFLIYVSRGSFDGVALVLFIAFVLCLAPALYLLKPFESRENLRRRREARKERGQPRNDDPPGGRGS